MSTPKRRRWTAEEKWRIITEARQTEHTVSEVCRQYGLATGQFYNWEKKSPTRCVGSTARWESRPEEERSNDSLTSRDPTASSSDCRTQRRESGAKKGGLAIEPFRRYRAEEKASILETVRRAQERTGQSVEILEQLGLPAATYYRWQAREQAGCLADRVVAPGRRVPPPTPREVSAVRDFALSHPQMGYKRLAWQMVDQDVACLRPYQVYDLLREGDLLSRRNVSNPEPLKRPPPPDHPDEVWHIDLMYLFIAPRWYYLVDILDGYSRFLVHWSLNPTMLAETVTLTVQEALEDLPQRRPGEPKIVHDRGSQFLSKEWREFVKGAGVTDIKTRVAHPQSNGVVERVHRTHREEGLDEEALSDYYRAIEGMTGWSHYYNHERPHSALKYLCPIDYYRGDPEARLAERQQKLRAAVETRRAYWAGL